MSIIEYAEAELSRIHQDEDGMQAIMNKDILDIIKIFADQGHSGFSANYAISILDRLLRFKPLSPLTGEDDEWVYRGDDHFQNKRCSSVFKNKDGSCCDVRAIIVSDNGGITWFCSGRFQKEITFPYAVPTYPEEVYIEYTGDEDEYEVITGDRDRIKALYERKRKEFDDD